MDNINRNAAPRECTEVGPGDYIKTNSGRFEKIVSNSAHGEQRAPKSWEITTEGGGRRSMWDVARYCKAEDVEK